MTGADPALPWPQTAAAEPMTVTTLRLPTALRGQCEQLAADLGVRESMVYRECIREGYAVLLRRMRRQAASVTTTATDQERT